MATSALSPRAGAPQLAATAFAPAAAAASPPAPAPVAPASSLHQDQQQHHRQIRQTASSIIASPASDPPGASQDPKITTIPEQSELDNSTSASFLDPPPDCCSSVPPSPPQFPTRLTSSISEESDEDSATVASRNEPMTPVSGRQSPVFPPVQTHDTDNVNTLHLFPAIPSESTKANLALQQSPFANNFQFPPETALAQLLLRQTSNTVKPALSASDTTTTETVAPLKVTSRTSSEDPAKFSAPVRRASIRSTASRIKIARTLSNMFSSARKTQSQPDELPPVVVSTPSYHGDTPERRWSMARSSGNTPLNVTPPSPSSPSEDGEPRPRSKHVMTSLEPPTEMLSKKNRASTGLNLRNRAVNFATGRNSKTLTRSSSFDASNTKPVVHNALPGEPIHNRQVFYRNPEQGVGVKARRLSLSLPDDFQVDVGELSQEFENTHKLFGRHRDGLGKGATARVRVMARKGFPVELYAVKEFRGKTAPETEKDYEKKVKSEFSIAKSLHHPNIIETVRLCVDHGRWNHVMEYCSEGDLFSLIKKGHLMTEDRKADRFCLFKQLVQGLAYLHANGIAHRDVKLENLLLTKESKLKITDFGVSEVFSGFHPGARESGGVCGKQMGDVRMCNPGICGSEPYIAPEVLAKEKKYDPRGLDVWGAGIVLIALMCGSTLWPAARDGGRDSENYTKFVRSFDKWNAKHPDGDPVYTEKDYPAYHIFDDYFNPPPLRRVLFMMLNPNPDKRASLEQVLTHRWVKNIECCQLESYDDPAVVIDATKKMPLNGKGAKKIFCHNHLPPPPSKTHSLGKMPGQDGY